MPHPLDKFRFCPACGSQDFRPNDFKSKVCGACGFVYYFNPCSATVAFIRNSSGGIAVVTRANDPARGTLDIPGGFVDMGETAEEGARREILEETGMEVRGMRYLFSVPNIYRYSGFDVHTLDMFFECWTDDEEKAQAMDDARDLVFMRPEDIDPSLFGLKSISTGIRRYLRMIQEEQS